MIPKVIYMCHNKLKNIEVYSQNWKNLNPEYEIALYDNKLCERFLSENFSRSHCDLFRFIPDGPIKADFWRVCVIYKYGGIYADSDIEPLVPLKEYINDDVDFVTCIIRKNLYNPHFIVSNRENKFLKLCIEKYLEYYTAKKEYSYVDYSIVSIFSSIFTYDFSCEGIYNVENSKYQFLKNVFENGELNEHSEYNGKRVFNNRYAIYNQETHNFSLEI